MSLAGFKSVSNDKLGSLLSRVTPEAIPYTASVVARNVRFKAKGVQTRFGLNQTSSIPSRYKVTGAQILALPNSSLQLPLFFGTQTFAEYASDTSLPASVGYVESPCGSGLTSIFYSSSTYDLYFDTAVAYARAFICGVTRPTTLIGSVATKQYGVMTQYDGSNGYNVSLAPQALTTSSSTSAVAGNVEAGDRYFVTLFQDKYGTIHGVSEAAISPYTALDSVHKVTVSGIPSYTIDGLITKRIVAFTVAGASQAGPYFYIPQDDMVDTIAITKTVIDDAATTTTIDFNFTDVYLQGSSCITSPIDFFDKIQLPYQGAVYYSPTTRRLVWCNGIDDATIFRLSEADDPGSYLGSTGFIKPAQNDGEVAVCAREFRSQLYLFKETAGFLTYNDAVNPSDWTVEKRWDRVGPVGPWAVDVNERFMIILDQSGVYLMDGSIPNCISDEISSVDSIIWQRINWQVKQKFWVFIDTDLDDIHVGVAVDGSTEVNMILRCNYVLGLSAGSRKWSYDDLPSSRMVQIQRTLPASPNPSTPVDSRIANSQILHLSNNYDGKINLVDPSSFMDNGNAVNSVYQTGYYEEPGVMQVGGIGLSMKGQGSCQVSILKQSNKRITLPRLLETGWVLVGAVAKCTGQSPWFAVEFSNNNVAGNWFEVTGCDLYVRKMWKARRIPSTPSG